MHCRGGSWRPLTTFRTVAAGVAHGGATAQSSLAPARRRGAVRAIYTKGLDQVQLGTVDSFWR
jgi:hypothetical protein